MKLATIKEVSQFIKVKESTLYSWASSGLMPSYKLNGLLRFDLDEIEEWVKSSKNLPVTLEEPIRKTRGDLDIDLLVKRAIKDIKSRKA